MSAIRPKARGRTLTGIANLGNNANGMPLNVRMPNGTTITLDVDPTDPVLWVKEKLEGFMGVDGLHKVSNDLSFAEQRLVCEGKPLEDTRTLSDYQIPPDSTILLNPTFIVLNVKMDTGKTVNVQVQSSDTVDNVKKLLSFWSKTPQWNGRLQQKVVGRVRSGRIAL
jgi:hypothetical protein